MIKLEHLSRWILASIQVHAQATKGDVFLWHEGQDRKVLDDHPDYLELRVGGPDMVQQTRTQFDFYVAIDIFINSKPDGKDFHKMARLQGMALLILTTCIKVMKYGDGPDDDKTTQIGILQRVENPKSPTTVASLGQIETTQPMNQGAVAGNYMLCLTDV